MTVLDERPKSFALPPLNRWEWHLFEADGWAHLYPVAELANRRLELLRPWCLLGAPFPLEHERSSIDPQPLLILRRNCSHVCPACTAHEWAAVPHPRAGTLLVGKFAGDLVEVVTHNGRS
ncbi:hypothetical protein ACIOD2_27345 [Amycolatopsis sp. NPDC088138]|uniref:hypothetical protein n=1 Tax=Amycolatopsis sp. NPDC088138 TaxID=3363938 RepID=UPI003803E672